MPKELVFVANTVFQKAKTGDSAALGQLLTKLTLQLRHCIAAKVPARYRPGLSADDLVQDTMLKVWANAPSFHGDSPKAFRSWVFAVGTHCRRNNMREQDTAKRRMGNIASIERCALAEDIVDARQLGGDVIAQENETDEKLSELAAMLSPTDRHIFSLHRAEYPIATIAEICNLDKSTIYKRWTHIKQFLYRELQKCGLIDT
jgi:RNA polymerase sigma factor (sigma-70 family)